MSFLFEGRSLAPGAVDRQKNCSGLSLGPARGSTSETGSLPQRSFTGSTLKGNLPDISPAGQRISLTSTRRPIVQQIVRQRPSRRGWLPKMWLTRTIAALKKDEEEGAAIHRRR